MDLGLSSLEKRSLRGNIIALYTFLSRGSGEGSAEHSSLGSSERRCGNGPKLCEGRFQLSIKESFP